MRILFYLVVSLALFVPIGVSAQDFSLCDFTVEPPDFDTEDPLERLLLTLQFSCGEENGQLLYDQMFNRTPTPVIGDIHPAHVPGLPGDGVPDVLYDPISGIVTLDTDGQAVGTVIINAPDFTNGMLLDGSPAGPSILPTVSSREGQLVTGSDGVERGFYSLHFNNSIQVAMHYDESNTGLVGKYSIAQYPAGLELGDIGFVEVAVYRDGTNDGMTWFSHGVSTQVVPEPSSLALILLSTFGVVISGRLRRQ